MKNKFEERKTKLRTVMDRQGLDALLFYANSLDSRYTKWIAGAQALAFHYFLITRDSSKFLEISYLAPELQLVTNEEVVELDDDGETSKQLTPILTEFKRIGIVGDAPFVHLKELDLTKLTDITEEVDQLMLCKTNDELSQINAAAKVLEHTFELVNKNLKPGNTTKELAKLIADYLLTNADALAFPISIATSKHLNESTIATPDDTVIQSSDMLCIDIGCIKSGFYSDATRMFFINNVDAEKRYKELKSINEEVISDIKAGITLGEIVKLYKVKLKNAKLPPTLELQDLGHSIGYGLHEYPNFYKVSQNEFELRAGMVITLEPEIVFTNYRLRVENMVEITIDNAVQLV